MYDAWCVLVLVSGVTSGVGAVVIWLVAPKPVRFRLILIFDIDFVLFLITGNAAPKSVRCALCASQRPTSCL
jgi:hypothetical protein